MKNSNKAKVMIVDDEVCIREMLKDILEGNGYLVTTEGNGLEALQKLKNEHFDTIISDIDMPGCSGFELLKKAKIIDSNANIIIMTASSNESYCCQSMYLGASGFFHKPFDIQQLLSNIECSIADKNRR